jgi:hypothetical protein
LVGDFLQITRSARPLKSRQLLDLLEEEREERGRNSIRRFMELYESSRVPFYLSPFYLSPFYLSFSSFLMTAARLKINCRNKLSVGSHSFNDVFRYGKSNTGIGVAKTNISHFRRKTQ